jgi:hypothetical protein
MSNFLAVATVTAVLRDLLQEAAGAAVPGAVVTTRRPEAAHDGAQNKPSVNIFLYLVAPNPAWRNTEIEIRYPDPQAPQDRARQRVEKSAQLPLNLSYLFSFYGNEQELEPHRLLGSVVSALHVQPRLPAQAIQRAVERERYLHESDLAFQVAQIENVTLTPISLDLEQLSKLWSVFFQVPYALSTAYLASAVLIESAAPKKTGVVAERKIEVKIPPDVQIPPEVLP